MQTFIESNTAFLKENSTLDGNAPGAHKHLPKGAGLTSEPLPVSATDPTVGVGKRLPGFKPFGPSRSGRWSGKSTPDVSLHRPPPLPSPVTFALFGSARVAEKGASTLSSLYGVNAATPRTIIATMTVRKGTYAAGRRNLR